MLGVIKKFSRLLDRHQKRRIVVLLMMMITGAFLETLSVSLMLPLVSAIMQPDIVESNAAVKWVCVMLDLHSHRTFTIVCVIILIVVFIFKDLFLTLEYYAQSRFVYNNRFAIQCQLFDAYMYRPYDYFLSAQSGEIVQVVQGDVNNVFGMLSMILTLATECIVSVVLVLAVFIISPAITAFVAIMMLLILLVITKVLKPILHQGGIALQRGNVSTNRWLLQAISGIKEIKAAQKEEFFQSHFKKNGKKLANAIKLNAVAQQIPRLLIEMVSVCSVLVVIAVLIYRGEPVETLIPALSAFTMAAIKLLPSANRIVSAANAVAYLEPALDKLLENLNELEDSMVNGETDHYDSPLSPKHEIVLRGISYRYPNSEKWVLLKADVTIPVGKSVGIVGASGSGKTTMIDILLGLLKPQEGQVLIDGIEMEKVYHEWLPHIGYIPQMIFMLDDSIRANVAFGYHSPDRDEGRLWKALEEAQLADFVRSLPEGLDTPIGERGVRLSGGQRQRIGIARALYHDPELLIFDEATSALDNETEAAIMESINALHGRKTMVIIAHRLTTIKECDIVYRVQDGKIVPE